MLYQYFIILNTVYLYSLIMEIQKNKSLLAKLLRRLMGTPPFTPPKKRVKLNY